MKRLLMLAAVGVLSFSGCIKNSKTELPPLGSMENLVSSLVQSEHNFKRDVLKLVELNRKMALRVFREGIAKQALIEAIKSGDDSKLRMASGISDEEYIVMLKSIESAKTAIFKKYPEALRNLELTRKCTPCEVENKIAVINKMPFEMVNGMEMIYSNDLANSIMPNSSAAELEPVDEFGCKQPHISICLLACAFSGPWAYPPCAYLCTLEYC